MGDDSRTQGSLHNMDRRKYIHGLAVSAVGAGIAGCGGDSSTPTSEDTPGDTQTTEADTGSSGQFEGDTVRWLTHFLDRQELFEEISGEFETQTGSTVDLTQIDPSSYRQNLSTSAGTSNAPDVFHHWGGPSDLGAYVENGTALALDDYLSSDILDAFSDNALLGCRYGSRDVGSWLDPDGDLYALPANYWGQGLVFNMDVLEEAGYDPQSLQFRADVSWEEFNQICGDIADMGVTPIAMGNQGNPKQTAMPVAISMLKMVGFETYRDTCWGNNDKPFTDDDYVEALSRWQELYDNGYVIDTVNAIERPTAIQNLYADEAAFYHQGTFVPNQIGQMLSNPEERGGIGEKIHFMWDFYYPEHYESGQNTLIAGIGAVNAVNAPRTEERGNREAAVGYLEHFNSPENAERLLTEGGFPVPRDGIWDQDLGSAEQFWADVLEETRQAEQTAPSPVTMLLPETREVFNAQHQNLFSGGDPEAIAEAVEEARQSDLE